MPAGKGAIMNMFLYYFFAWPLILIGAVASFVVWEILSNRRWKERRTQNNPAIPWQNQAIEARRQFRDLDYKTRRKIEELEEALRREKARSVR